MILCAILRKAKRGALDKELADLCCWFHGRFQWFLVIYSVVDNDIDVNSAVSRE